MNPSSDPNDRPPFDAADRAIAAALRGTAPPRGLKEAILAAQAEEAAQAKIVRGPWFSRPSVWLAAAAMLIAAFAIFAGFGRGASFDSFRERVASVDTRKAMAGGTPFTLETRDVREINAFLRTSNLVGDLTTFRPPSAYAALGCRVLEWKGVRYSVVCFYDDKGNGVHLYMAKSAGFDRDPGGSPQYADVSGLRTASWSKAGVSYVLVGPETIDLRQIVAPAQG